MSMTHIHSDDCCINMQYRDQTEDAPTAPPPFGMWQYYYDQLVEALNEKYFTGAANFYWDREGQQPMILVLVTGDTQDQMEEKFGRFMQARRDITSGLFGGETNHESADDSEEDSDDETVEGEADQLEEDHGRTHAAEGVA